MEGRWWHREKGFRLLKGKKKGSKTLKRREGPERGVERESERGLLERQSMNSSHAEEEGGECVKIWTMKWEGRADREELGEGGSWRRRREKEVSRGAEPGVRGFEDDSREMDALEECGSFLYI